MPVFGTQNFGSGAVSAYEIDNSCIFNDDDSPSLSFTPGSAGNQKTWTLSFWFKISRNAQTTSAGMNPFSAGGGNFEFLHSDGDSGFYLIDGGGLRKTSAAFRDMSAWSHMILASDTTQASEGNRMKMYHNGVLITNFSVDNTITLNKDFNINSAAAQILGQRGNAGYWDGYLAEFIFVDGTQLAATALGEFDDNGVWTPINPSGLTFGTNGYWLDFEDSSALGNDVSGNNNDFTPSNLAAGDQSTDTPTNNQITFNYLNNQQTGGTLTQGNTVYSGPSTRTLVSLTSNIPPTGKWAVAFSTNDVSTNNGWNFGFTKSNNSNFGDAAGSNEDLGASDGINMNPSGSVLYLWNYIAGSGIEPGQAITTSDEFWLAVDMATGNCFLGIYDASATAMVWVAADAGLDGNPATGANPSVTISDMIGSTEYTFGVAAKSPDLTLIKSADLAGTIPTGYTYFENVSDLPAPVVTDPSTNFQVALWSGNSSTQTITFGGNSDMQPDMVWAKSRSNADAHVLQEVNTGVGTAHFLTRTDSDAVTDAVTAFNSDGFALGDGSELSNGTINTTSRTYAAWCWKAGGSGSSNTTGTINTTKTSVDTTSGFGISTYTGNGSDQATYGHGLGVVPAAVWTLSLTSSDHRPSSTWVSGVTAFSQKTGIDSVADAFGSSSAGLGNVENASSTVFTLGTDPGVNGSGVTYMSMYWAEVAGFSRFGSYTGNANADGNFAYCGFSPQLIIFKTNAGGEDWVMFDRARDTYNPAGKYIYPTTDAAEATGSTFKVDFLSNGFKLRAVDGRYNKSGVVTIWMAFAKRPFGGDGVAPATAR